LVTNIGARAASESIIRAKRTATRVRLRHRKQTADSKLEFAIVSDRSRHLDTTRTRVDVTAIEC